MPSEKVHKDGGVAENQERADEAARKGYIGQVPDPTPNFNYTVAGNDEPTPETDRELQRALQDRSREIEEAWSDVRPQPDNPADTGRSRSRRESDAGDGE